MAASMASPQEIHDGVPVVINFGGLSNAAGDLHGAAGGQAGASSPRSTASPVIASPLVPGSPGAATCGRTRSVSDLPDLTSRIQSMGLYEEYQRFRDGYLRWRGQGHQGARGEHTAEVLASRATDRQFEKCFPTYSAWKFWRTMSFWIAVFFTQGSWLFVFASLFACFPRYTKRHDFKALTAWPTLIAGTFFWLGSYMMCLESVHLFQRDREKQWSPFPSGEFFEDNERSRWPYLASLMYFLGCTVFTVDLVAGLFTPLDGLLEVLLIEIPGAVGGLFFALGGFLECMETKAFLSCPRKIVQWGALANFVGGVCFLVGGVVIFWPDQDLLSSIAFTVGSALFVLGSLVSIFLWRDEQFGLTFLSALNEFKTQPRPGQAARPPRFSWRGFVFINIYCVISVVSVFNLCLEAFQYSHTPTWLHLTKVFNEFLPLAMVSFVLVVHSAAVKTPKAQPWRLLIMCARWLALFIGANSMLSFCLLVSPEAPPPQPPGPFPPGPPPAPEGDGLGWRAASQHHVLV